jgi:acetyltransferase-like isoleucine patch superfamily enzyme
LDPLGREPAQDEGIPLARRRVRTSVRSVVPAFFDSARLRSGDFVLATWERLARRATVGPESARARRFRRFGAGAALCAPFVTLFGEEFVEIGDGTIIGPYCTLSAGVMPGHVPDHVPTIRIGDRCLLGKGSGIVAHRSIEIGDDTFTGHDVYITDANHGYEDTALPIGRQFSAPRPVRIGSGSWLGHGTVVLPGSVIGNHVTVGAGSVVAGDLPDLSVAVGNPARVIRRYRGGDGWVRVDR